MDAIVALPLCHLDREHLEDVEAVGLFHGEFQYVFGTCQFLDQLKAERTPALVHVIELLHLFDADGCEDVAEAKIESRPYGDPGPRRIRRHTLLGRLVDPVTHQLTDFCREGGIFGGQHAAFAGGDVLGGKEAPATDTPRPGRLVKSETGSSMITFSSA